MDLIYIMKGLLIAVVEGITEFLPISSTGHMILADGFLKFGNGPFENMYMVVIQLGAILSIIVLYWEKIWALIRAFFKGEERGKKFVFSILIGIIPAFIFGFLLEDFIDEKLFNSYTVIAGLLVGAILLIFMENKYRGKADTYNVDRITPKKALVVGLFQVLALWPGMSRSSSTIMGGWKEGLSPETAAEFSFFLAIPIMVGASGLKLIKFFKGAGVATMGITQWVTLILGFGVAFIVALICVSGFMSFIKKKPMKVFAYYRIAISLILIALLVSGKLKF